MERRRGQQHRPAFTDPDVHAPYVGGAIAALAQVIETGYSLHPALIDDDTDEITGYGPDIAPGLHAAVVAAWTTRHGQPPIQPATATGA